MKIEVDDNSLWLGIAFSIVLMAIALVWINHLNERQFIEHGYTRETLPGETLPGVSRGQWVKK